MLLRSQSRLHDRRGDPDQALKSLRHALNTFDDLADERCAAYKLMEIGRVYSGRRDREHAMPALRAAARVLHRYGDRDDEAACWQLLGTLDVATGDPESARYHLGQALRLWRAIGDVKQSGAVARRQVAADPWPRLHP